VGHAGPQVEGYALTWYSEIIIIIIIISATVAAIRDTFTLALTISKTTVMIMIIMMIIIIMFIIDLCIRIHVLHVIYVIQHSRFTVEGMLYVECTTLNVVPVRLVKDVVLFVDLWICGFIDLRLL